jgi:hypothetical protein
MYRKKLISCCLINYLQQFNRITEFTEVRDECLKGDKSVDSFFD